MFRRLKTKDQDYGKSVVKTYHFKECKYWFHVLQIGSSRIGAIESRKGIQTELDNPVYTVPVECLELLTHNDDVNSIVWRKRCQQDDSKLTYFVIEYS